MATVYLKSGEYLELASVDSLDDGWLYGPSNDDGNRIFIPVSSILYVEEEDNENK